jgi:alpha,alpha-trehalose phosphorylase
VITFDPRLPDSWERLKFSVTLHGTRLAVELTRTQITFTVIDGASAKLAVRGHRVTVSAEAPVRVPLSDQGLDLADPTPSKLADRRPDGTMITPSVPHAAGVRRAG